jgi:hypothetical protein
MMPTARHGSIFGSAVTAKCFPHCEGTLVKYAKTAWLTVQGLALIAFVGYALLVIKERYVDGSRAMSHGVFVILVGGALGGAYGFAAKRVLSEIRRVRGDGVRR